MDNSITELQVHFWLVLLTFALAAQTFVMLLVVNAPYGRFSRAGWGVAIPARTAWVMFEPSMHGERQGAGGGPHRTSRDQNCAWYMMPGALKYPGNVALTRPNSPAPGEVEPEEQQVAAK